MNKDSSFIYKGEVCVRQLLCYSDGVKVIDIDKDSPIVGLNSDTTFMDAYRQLNANIQPNIIDGLVKFWDSDPDLKFRFLFISFQKYIGTNAAMIKKDPELGNRVLSLFMSLFQQILSEISPQILQRKPISTILRFSALSNSSNLIKVSREFDIVYQKSLKFQADDSFVPRNISKPSADLYKKLIEELVKLLTIKLV